MSPEISSTELPLHGRVPKNAVLARYGRLIAEARCECPPCVAAGVEGPPVLAPAGVELVDGHVVAMGLWLHGWRLRELELEKAKFKRAFDALMTRIAERRAS